MLSNPRGLMASSGASGGYTILNSVYGDGSTGYFSRTPAGAGTNNKIWTFSKWIKRTKLGSAEQIFNAGTAAGDLTFIQFNSGDTLSVGFNKASVDVGNRTTSQLFRDTGSFFHLLVVVDTTNGTASDRIKIFINGAQVTSFSATTAVALNETTYVGDAVAHYIGRYIPSAASYTNYYMTEAILVDGQALSPSSFGETDTTTGSWKPKRYTGTYGTNGFYLPFTNSTNFGLDYKSGTPDATEAKTSLLLNFEGADAATSTTDGSPYSLPVTFAGNAQIDTAQFKWGASSLLCDGTGDYVTVPDNEVLDLSGGGDWTIEMWCRFNSLAAHQPLFGHDTDASNFIQSYVETASGLTMAIYAAGSPVVTLSQGSTAGWATNTWYHICFEHSGTTYRSYRDGVVISTSVDADNIANYTGTFKICAERSTATFNGWMDGFRVTKGLARYNGAFTPPSAAFTDISTKCNHFTKNGTVTQTTDSPTDKAADNIGNYYTYNPTAAMSGLTFGSGNLNISSVTAGAWRRWCFTGTPLTSGKWYWEIKATTASDKSLSIGVQGLSDGFRFDTNDVIGSSSGSATGWSFQLSGTKWNNGSSGAYGSFTSGDTIMIAYDADNQKIWWGSNGTWFSSGDPAAGTNAAFSSVTATGGLIPACSCATADFSEIRLNSGQTAFAYTPPTGFSRLSTANLPAPTIKNDDLHFNVVTYTGTGASLSITGVGFQPDFVWIKSRSAATDHALYDAVRGVQKRLETNNSDAEVTSDGGITSFDSDGFTLGTLAQVNTNTATYVAWCWKGNGSGSSNTSGSITSTVSANTTAGISIVTYTGNATAGATVGHGLGAAPKFMIFKSRSSTGFGRTFHTSLGATKYIDLTTDAAVTSATAWNDTAPSSTVFTLGTGTPNDNTVTQVAYCFVEVSGFSKFGTYTGNGAADGPFVWCGFRPKFVLLKIASGGTGHWLIYDTARSTYNLVQANLGASAATADEVTSNMLDIVSNGFKFRTADGTSNLSGGTFIFAAFAEYPFGGTGTTQGKAR